MTLIVILSLFAFSFSACVAPNPSGNPQVPLETESQSNVTDDLKLAEEYSQDHLDPNQQLTPPGEPTMNDQISVQETTSPQITATKAVIKTSKGNITLKLYPDQAPNTVSNFATKSAAGFYDGLTFHRVEDWVIQGGDPLGNGTGGGKMPTELNEVPFAEGSLGVARGGDIRVSNDAQFFICTTDCAWLTGQYTNFGQVIEGMDVAKQIEVGDTIVGIEVIE